MKLRSLPWITLAALALAGCNAPSLENVRWMKGFGDANDQGATGLAVDASGNTVLIGSFVKSIGFGGGSDLESQGPSGATFVAMLDAQGGHVWSTAIGGSGAAQPRGVVTTADGTTLVAGSFNGDITAGSDSLHALTTDTFLLAVAPTGRISWWKHWSADDGGPSGTGTSDPAGGVAVDPHGDVILAGHFTGTLGFGGDPLDAPLQSAFITKLRPDGSFVWSRSYSDNGIELTVTSMAVDAGGDILIAGGVAPASSDSFVPPGPFVARFDPQGKLRWDVRFTDAATASASSIALDPDGNAIVVGSYVGTELTAGSLHLGEADDFAPFVIALSPAGKVEWADTFGDPGTTAMAVVADKDRVIVTGTYSGTFGGKLAKRGMPEAYLIELSPKGDVQTVAGLSDLATPIDESGATGLALQGGDLVMGGTFHGQLSLGDQSLTAQGGFDAFVGRVKP